ncbi:amino acid carrier protein [Oceanococcus atlanticus]|uniref:Amino acid carrier protein n=1 Tax=Oceanococcus atlanticus TaxID=1317117 RepID=A0A1Y1SDG1_9GAMM|nr:alanine/glycine:cation symporter family protein [Oceanococcus atlanticus]ORE87045.1 amino acid carrier protein [Oceanococcus atlanticus]RZO86797.1 MAG: alanine:cation symporter family protein [Oceanococcus sp.]
MTGIENALAQFASFVWGMPLVVLLLGGGLTLLLFSRGAPYRLLPHAIGLLRGDARHQDQDAPGQLSHFQALSAALAGTIGLGNIAGVAVAVELGGPGAIFWMWMTAVVGVATKFFTGTLAVMYRGRDDQGGLRGGPMWVIHEALSARYRPLAYLFCVAGLIGCLPSLQVNQLVETTQALVLAPRGWDHDLAPLILGLIIMLACWLIVRGGIVRIGAVAARVVPTMCVIYLLAIGGILLVHWSAVVPALLSIFREAFSLQAAGTGGLVAIILLGVRRGLFSNEAGIGTEVMAHGTARTSEPVREGIVAMLGPIIDTLIVCTATALALLVTDVASVSELSGASLTSQAFESVYAGYGVALLYLMVLIFGVTTITTYWFYGAQCAVYLFGARAEIWYRTLYLLSIVFVAMLPLHAALNLIDGMYALMAIPTMTATLLLAPKVLAASRDYVVRMRQV